MPPLPRQSNRRAATPECERIPIPTTLSLATPALVIRPAAWTSLTSGVKQLGGGRQIVLVDREGNVGRAVLGNALHDHVHADVAARDRGKNPAGDAGLVADVVDGHLGLVALQADAADDDVFHVRGFFLGDGARGVLEAGTHFEFHAEFLGELDRARLHHLRAGAGHLEQLVVGDFVDLLRVGDDARIAGKDAVDVGENLAGIGVQRAGQGDRGQIGAAAAERGRFAIGVLSLEPGDDDDVIFREQRVDLSRRDVGDLRAGMGAIGQDAGFGAGQRNRLPAERVDRHGGERDCRLFAGGEQHVHLALRRVAATFRARA